MRSKSRMICSIIRLRRLRFCDLSRNSIAAHGTRRKRMRLMRWIMIGELTSAAPAIIVYGLRNALNIENPSRSTVHDGVTAALHGGEAEVEELGQGRIQIVAGSHKGVIDAPTRAAAPNFHEVLLQRLHIPVAYRF